MRSRDDGSKPPGRLPIHWLSIMKCYNGWNQQRLTSLRVRSSSSKIVVTHVAVQQCLCKKTRRSSRENKDLIWSGVKCQRGECHVSWGWGVRVRSLDQIIAADLTYVVSMGIKTHDLPTLCQRGHMVRSAAIRSLIEWPETLPNAFMTWDTHYSAASPHPWHLTPDQIKSLFSLLERRVFLQRHCWTQHGWQQLQLLLLTLKLVSLCWFHPL